MSEAAAPSIAPPVAPKAGPYHCRVCRREFKSNPLLERWLAGKLHVDQYPKVELCWVCRRLDVSVEREAAMLAAEAEGL